MACEGGLLQELVGLAGRDINTLFLILVEVLSFFTDRHRSTPVRCLHQILIILTDWDVFAFFFLFAEVLSVSTVGYGLAGVGGLLKILVL